MASFCIAAALGQIEVLQAHSSTHAERPGPQFARYRVNATRTGEADPLCVKFQRSSMSKRPPVRVVHVVGGSLSGCTRMVLALVSGHDRSQFDPAVCFFSIMPADERACDQLDQQKVPWREVVKQSRYEVAALDRLQAALESLRPQVVLLHGFGVYNYGALAARLAGASKVIRVEHSPELYGPLYQWFSAAVVPWVDSTIAVSNYLIDYLRTKGTALPVSEVIYNGLALAPFAKLRAPFAKHPVPVLLMTARFDVAKDHRTLLRAAAALVKRGHKFRLRLAGEGPLEKELRAFTREFGLHEQVEFVGFVQDLPALLGEADIAVLSTHYEGFGLAVAEAMAAARPIVATRVAAIPELLQEGVQGRLVTARAPEELAQAISELLSDPEAATKMGQRGQKRAQELFAIEKTVQAYEHHILNLLGREVSADEAPMQISDRA